MDGSESSFCCASKEDKKQSTSAFADVYFLLGFIVIPTRLNRKVGYRLMRNHLAVNDEKNVNSELLYSEMHVPRVMLFIFNLHMFSSYVWRQMKKNVIRRHEQTNRKMTKNLMDFLYIAGSRCSYFIFLLLSHFFSSFSNLESRRRYFSHENLKPRLKRT